MSLSKEKAHAGASSLADFVSSQLEPAFGKGNIHNLRPVLRRTFMPSKFLRIDGRKASMQGEWDQRK
jgi:hypothetical protein